MPRRGSSKPPAEPVVKPYGCDLSCPHPVYRWIHGHALPSTDNLYRLSKIFQIHMEDLLIEVDTGHKVDKSE